MAWNPCDDLNLNCIYDSEIWKSLQTVYDTAYPTGPLPRISENEVRLVNDYIIERQGVICDSVQSGYSQIPNFLRHYRLGYYELDMLDWLFNCLPERKMFLVGPRGAGKSTFLHYIEYLILDSRDNLQIPIPFFVDMGDCQDCDTINEVLKRIVYNLSIEAQKKSSVLPENLKSFKDTLLEIPKKISAEISKTNIANLFLNLKTKHPWHDPRSIIFIFDNLDQMNFKSVNICIKLMNELWSKAEIGSILSVRPSLYNHIIDDNAARTRVPASIRITPPCLQAWLRNFPARMARAYECLVYNGEPRELDGVALTAKRIYDVSDRISLLLKTRVEEDDSARFMEALSSHDMRHFNGLIRRLLANRNLPKDWLLRDIDTDSIPDFYPMYAIMQGERRWFTHNDYVPNLLAFSPKEKKTDFLIFHRILSVLGRKKPPMKLYDIFLTLKEYGANKEEVIPALEILRRANVIYGSNIETNWSNDQLPEYCGLTESGVYFLNFLLSNSNYLVSAVLNVPLSHENLQQHLKDDIFLPTIYSLLEYLEAVKNEENRQLSFMRRRPPSDHLALAVGRLQHGNSFFGKVLKGFKDIVLRGAKSSSPPVKSACKRLKKKIPKLEAAKESIELAIEEILNRAVKNEPIHIPFPERGVYDQNKEIQVKYHQDGARLRAIFEIESNLKNCFALLLVRRSSSKAHLYPSVVLEKRSSIDTKLEGVLNDVVPEEKSKLIDRTLPIFIDCDKHRKHKKFPAVLDISLNDGMLQIFLTISKNGDMERHIVGESIDYQTLKNWSTPKLEKIQERAKSNRLEIGGIKGFGIGLSQKVLSAKGINLLNNLIPQIGSCLLVTDFREIPWEWLLPATDVSDGELICDNWIITRAPVKNSRWQSSFIHTNFGQPTSPTLRTVGLKKEGDQKQWRSKIPTSPTEALQLIDKSGFVHLVAHAESSTELKFVGEHHWEFTQEDVLGFTPRKKENAQEIIISACKCGAENEPNMAIEIANKFKCPTWAPLLDINIDSCAEQLDNEISKIYKDTTLTGVSHIFQKLRKTLPFVYLYVCYASG